MLAARRGRHHAVAVLLAGALLAAGCAGGDAGSQKPGQAVPPAVQADAARIQEGYVGSESCRECHAEEVSAWKESRHHAIFREGDTPAYMGTVPASYQRGGLNVTPVTMPAPAGNGGSPRPAMRVDAGGATGEFAVDAVIGGGRMESYATKLPDGAWLLLPLSYQVEQRTFMSYEDGTCGVESLGLETPAWHSYGRVWNHRCIDCHVTGGSIGFDAKNETYSSSFIDAGAGCEACHGPGKAHLQAAREGRGAEGIVNPGQSETAAATGICASCHALALPFESRWGGNLPYRAGDDYLDSYLPLLRMQERSPYTDLTHADHTPAAGVMEYQGLVQSLCYLRGNATCVTCHDPHGAGVAPHALKAPAAGSGLCMNCHLEIDEQGEAHTHHLAGTPGGSCVDCHMAPTVKALGTRLASHAIDIPIPASNVDHGVPDACTLCHADRGAEWTAAQAARLWGSPENYRRRQLTEAFAGDDMPALRRLLADEQESELLRADAAAALARVAGAQAGADLVQALRSAGSPLVRRYAADFLGGMGAPVGSSLEQQVEHFARLEEVGVMQALKDAVAAGPLPVRLSAAAGLAHLGTEGALERLEALRREPVLEAGYRLHQLLGKYYLLAQRMDESAAAYERVLQRSPNYLAVIEDLGFVYFTTSRFQEARDIWMRGLTLNPDNEDLKLKVHLAEDQIRGQSLKPEEAASPGS